MRRWVVINNVTGEAASRDYDSEQKATALCAAFNIDAHRAGAGGLYGVREVDDAHKLWQAAVARGETLLGLGDWTFQENQRKEASRG